MCHQHNCPKKDVLRFGGIHTFLCITLYLHYALNHLPDDLLTLRKLLTTIFGNVLFFE